MIFKTITNILHLGHHAHSPSPNEKESKKSPESKDKKSPRTEWMPTPFRRQRSKSKELGLGLGQHAKKESISAPPCSIEITRVDSHVCGANFPVEDRVLVNTDGKHGGFYGVFDGHGGVEAADYTCTNVEGHFRKELKEGRKSSPKNETKCMFAKRVRASLQNAFSRTEASFKDSLHVDAEHPNRATVGTCALAAYIENGTLFVANAGDSRAIIGRRGFNNTLTAVAMSEDHNANQPREQRRLLYEHPDEVDLLEPHGSTLYLKGCLQTTRSIGDFYLKDPSINAVLESPVMLLSPPYVTSDAQVFTYDLGKNDEFLVMASDGLWEYVSNDEVVEAVHKHGDSAKTGEYLRDIVLARAAAENKLSVEKLKKTPQGVQRRKLHDDISIVVVYFGCAASSP